MKNLLIVFTLLSINIFANMDAPPQKVERTHHKHYMKKIHEDENLSYEQRSEIMLLRMDFINKDRALDRDLKKLRRDMNHCMRSDRDNKDEEYENLKIEREKLRREKGRLKREYKDAVSEILKKQ